jgi:hypothetical protein
VAGAIEIPTVVLAAAGQPGAGRIAFVLGAGCSFEAPTDLPLSKPLAEESHRQLVLNGVIDEVDCTDPSDLSCVADAVFTRCGRQRELVEVLPRTRMRMARPNDGSLIAAALLLEGVAHHVVVLNYDLSLPNALVQLGAEDEVHILRGPEDHAELGLSNCIFLHRSVDADPESWVLRTSTLNDAWKNGWEQVVAQIVLPSPVVVFAGLGTPVGVLIETVKRIRQTLPEGTASVVVDPMPRAESAYASELGLGDDRYVQAGWGAFARRVSERLVAEHEAELKNACRALHDRDGLDDEGAEDLCRRASELGLLGLGRLRAQWLLSSRAYVPAQRMNVEHISDLLLALGTIERTLGASARLGEDGLVELWVDDRVVAVVRMGSGEGARRWSSLEQRIRSRQGRVPPTVAVVSGFVGPALTATPPASVVRGAAVSHSILGAEGGFSILAADDIRNDPERLREAVAA